MKYAVAMMAVAVGMLVCTAPEVASAQNRRIERGTSFGPSGVSIGVSVRDVRSTDLTAAKLTRPDGVFIEAVQSGTPAEQAGLKNGDIVLDFDGEHVRSARHFVRLVQETPPGRSVGVAVNRNGARQTLNVTPREEVSPELGDLEGLGARIERGLRSMPLPPELGGPQAQGRLGVSLMPLSDQLASYFGVRGGVLVSSVVADSPAARANLKAGDVITVIGGQRVSSPSDVVARLREVAPDTTVEVELTRDKKNMSVHVRLPDAKRLRPRDAVGI